MHQKLTKHGKFCKQNNQLPTKSHDELEDNPIVSKNLSGHWSQVMCVRHIHNQHRFETHHYVPLSYIDVLKSMVVVHTQCVSFKLSVGFWVHVPYIVAFQTKT
jgi:hypothetical protein